MKVINPDMIARQLEPDRWDEPATMLKAGRIAVSERQALTRDGQTFAMETRLTGQSELRVMAGAKAA